jgi:hypothetical protein
VSAQVRAGTHVGYLSDHLVAAEHLVVEHNSMAWTGRRRQIARLDADRLGEVPKVGEMSRPAGPPG